jgi:hypothetical protein
VTDDDGVPQRKWQHAHAQLAAAATACTTTATTSSAWATWCKWLATQAEALGVEIFPGFAAAEVLYNDDGSVKGVATGNMGIGKDGEPHGGFQLGMELHAKYTVFAEGARGHLGKQLIAKFKLDEGKDPQTYGAGRQGIVGDRPRQGHQPGLVLHTAGWPMDETPMAAASSTTWKATRSRWASLPGWTTEPLPEPVRGDSSAGRPTSAGPRRTRASKAASAWATARAPSPPAACSRCPSWCSRAAPWWAARRAS